MYVYMYYLPIQVHIIITLISMSTFESVFVYSSCFIIRPCCREGD